MVPGSHRLGVLAHTDTFSHLGFDKRDGAWTDAVPITGEAGDGICFHVNTIHGSQENHSNSRRPIFQNRI
ncbi:MAG: phytanoyl-CoA dioxygenase family protein [Dehalococcoidia bacterium]|nr:phytanoyl-CoA dioxygenase family protein [Dehalococcoidia bacterium]